MVFFILTNNVIYLQPRNKIRFIFIKGTTSLGFFGLIKYRESKSVFWLFRFVNLSLQNFFFNNKNKKGVYLDLSILSRRERR